MILLFFCFSAREVSEAFSQLEKLRKNQKAMEDMLQKVTNHMNQLDVEWLHLCYVAKQTETTKQVQTSTPFESAANINCKEANFDVPIKTVFPSEEEEDSN